MNKKILSLALITGLVVSNVSVAFADTLKTDVTLPNLEVTNLSEVSNASIVSDRSSVNYSDFLKNGGGEQWINLELKGAKITTTNPSKLHDAITQNYDVQTTLALPSHGTSFEFGVFAPNSGIEYIDNWEITIDSSVLDIDQDLTVKIPVVNDLGVSETPKIVASKTSVTKDELMNGFDITLEITDGVRFNTSCFANAPRVSIIKTANMGLEVLPYCNAISSNKITFYIKAMNNIPVYRDTLEFRIEGDATNSNVPMIVKLDIVSDVNQSDLDKLKDMITNAPTVSLNDYTQESYVKFQSTIREATRLAYSSNPGQVEVKEMINKLGNAIDLLEKKVDLNELVKIEDSSLKSAIKKSLGIKSNDITVGDMQKLKALNFEDDMYLTSLNGLEYAINLENLNVNYNEVKDLSPLKNLTNLKEFTGLENFIMNNGSLKPSEDNFFEIELIATDLDGKKMLPKEVVLSPNTNPQKLKIEDVLVDGKIKIDSSLVNLTDSVEILYESEYNNFQVYSFYFLQNK